jgi:hypothetical protein
VKCIGGDTAATTRALIEIQNKISTNTQNTHMHAPETPESHDAASVSGKRPLKQTFLEYDVHVSDPITDDYLTPSWPGREPDRVQTRLDGFLRSVGARTAATAAAPSSHQPHGIGIESIAD